MIRRFLIILTIITSAAYSSKAQNGYKINLNIYKNTKAVINSVDIITNDIYICVSIHGKILVEGSNATELDYWANTDGDYRQGKPKLIGNVSIDYYDNNNAIGKLKSIGDMDVTYYDAYDGPDNIGRLKSIGKLVFTYYDRFDGTDNPGKLKSIGANKITYYDKYDGFDNIGKLKTIGNTKITYYDRFDLPEKFGAIKQIDGNNKHLNIRTIQKLDDEQ